MGPISYAASERVVIELHPTDSLQYFLTSLALRARWAILGIGTGRLLHVKESPETKVRPPRKV